MNIHPSFHPFKIISDPEDFFIMEDFEEPIEQQVLCDIPSHPEEDCQYDHPDPPNPDGYEDPELYHEQEYSMSDFSDYDDEDEDYDAAIDKYDSDVLDSPESIIEEEDAAFEEDEYEEEDGICLDEDIEPEDGIVPSPFDEYDDVGIEEDPDFTEI